MNASNVIAIVSIVAGACVTIMAGWLQYRGTRMAQRQERLLSYENRIGEKRISTYHDVLAAALPIRNWGQEFIVGHMTVPPALEISQELLVNLAMFGSNDVNTLMNQIVKTLESVRFTLKQNKADLDKFTAIIDKFGGLEDFEAALTKEGPQSHAMWSAIKSAFSGAIEMITMQIDHLENRIRGEIQDAPISSMSVSFQYWRTQRRIQRSFRHWIKIATGSSPK
jgi:hypothetical protein